MRRRVGTLVACFTLIALPSAARAATGSLTLSTTPGSGQIFDNTTFTVTASGTTDDTGGNAAIEVDHMPAGTTSCPPNPGGDFNLFTTGQITGSPFSFQSGSTGPWTVGHNVVCAWIVDSSLDPSTVAVSAPLTIDVGAADTISLAADRNPTIDGRQTTIAATGHAYDSTSVYMTFKPAGGGCAARPGQDSGTSLLEAADTGAGFGASAYEVDAMHSFDQGTYLICAWLMPINAGSGDPPVVPPTSMTLSVVPVHASASISAPATVASGDTAAIKVTYSTDAPRELLVAMQPASAGGCAAAFAKKPATATEIADESISGAGTKSYSGGLDKTTVFCAWVQRSADAASADFGPASATIKVTPPPPPRTYKGKTSQHLAFLIRLQGTTVIELKFKERFHCHPPITFSSDIGAQSLGPVKLSSKGRFAAKLDGNPNNRLHISGRLKGKRITGTFTGKGVAGALASNSSRETCGTGRVRFSARRR